LVLRALFLTINNTINPTVTIIAIAPAIKGVSEFGRTHKNNPQFLPPDPRILTLNDHSGTGFVTYELAEFILDMSQPLCFDFSSICVDHGSMVVLLMTVQPDILHLHLPMMYSRYPNQKLYTIDS
jgi:hypothetical protein